MKRLMILLLLPLLLIFQTSGFVIPQGTRSQSIRISNHIRYPSSHGPTVPIVSSSCLSLANNNNKDDEKNETKNSNSPPIDFRKLRGPIIIGFLAFQAAANLVIRDLPPILRGQPNADYIGAILDTIVFGWAGTNFLLQTGMGADSLDGEDEGISLEGLECQVTIDVGREPGTWMDKEWAVSGARLVLPIKVRFTNENFDLGIPGEEGLGGRYCRKLEVLENTVSFVGLQGQINIPVKDGGWATLPILDQKLESGERKLRFFLEFPSGAQRNDVSIPAGRVFFSSIALPCEAASNNSRTILSPNGSGILPEGGVTIKSDGGIMNLWGAVGDINLILGRYSVRA